MEFIKDNIYHIYNQGNNRHEVFYNRENYGFFLQKMKDYLLPYCDIMAWCLMPNHFHWMVYVRETEIDRVTSTSRGDRAIDRVTSSHPVNNRSLNDSIAIILRSYTRAINIQQNRSGSLFRQQTKAECITKPQEVSPSYFNMGFGTLIYIPDPEKEYPQICFDYIHNNPVKAGLVKCPEDWEFSSFRDLSGIRNGKLVCRQRVEQFELHL